MTLPRKSCLGIVFFIAACSVMLSTVYGGFIMLVDAKLVETFEMVYLFTFSSFLVFLDTPFVVRTKGMYDLRMYIGKYIEILTRIMGKGVAFIFLGSVSFASLWSTAPSLFVGVPAASVALFSVGVGATAICLGVRKSRKLNRLRMALAQKDVLEKDFEKHAVALAGRGPETGLLPDEFNCLSREHGMTWDTTDLQLIFNALVSNPSWRVIRHQGAQTRFTSRVTFDDLSSWVSGGIVWL